MATSSDVSLLKFAKPSGSKTATLFIGALAICHGHVWRRTFESQQGKQAIPGANTFFIHIDTNFTQTGTSYNTLRGLFYSVMTTILANPRRSVAELNGSDTCRTRNWSSFNVWNQKPRGCGRKFQVCWVSLISD